MSAANFDTALRLLQVVGLSLPAVALYMGVLVEIHMTTRRVTGVKMEPKGDREWRDNVYEFKPDRYTARLTDAASTPDFFFAILSLISLLLSGLLFGAFIAVKEQAIFQTGLAVLVGSYIVLAMSCGLLLRISYLSFRRDD